MKKIYLLSMFFLSLNPAQADTITGIMAANSMNFGLQNQKAILVDLNLDQGPKKPVYNARGFDMRSCQGCTEIRPTTRISKKVGNQVTVVSPGYQLPANKSQKRADSYLELVESSRITQRDNFLQSQETYSVIMPLTSSPIVVVGQIVCSTVQKQQIKNPNAAIPEPHSLRNPVTPALPFEPLETKRCSFDLRTQNTSPAAATIFNDHEAVQILSMVYQEMSTSSLFK